MRTKNSYAAAVAAAIAAVVFSAVFQPTEARAVTIDWVTVGDPGNAADTTGNPNPAGAVAAAFNIMKFEFTNQQYTQFLNTVDANGTNPNSVYNTNMGSNPRGGISFTTGNSPGSKYAVRSNMGDKPVNYVSWFDAARVSNWLMNGATGTSSMETGAYTLNNATSGTAPAVNSGASYYIPTENQWYKAAYYVGSGTNAGYWDYPTQTNTAPTAVTAGPTGIGSSGSTGNTANFNRSADWNAQDGNVTTVGTNGGPSAYGAFDMGGNLGEWNDLTGAGGSQLGVRGGDWSLTQSFLPSNSRNTISPAGEFDYLGFRIVVVPEPTQMVFVAGVGAALGAWRLRKLRRNGRGS